VHVSLDHVHIVSSKLCATRGSFCRTLDATVVWDEQAAGAGNLRLARRRAFIFVYDQPPHGRPGGVVHPLGIEADDLGAPVAGMTANGFRFRHPVREEPRFRYEMIAGPDELLIERFECREPERWQIRR